MKEEVLQFGKRSSMVGILHSPAGTPNPELPAVLLLNAGLIHRIGPNRIYVKMARQFAPEGSLKAGRAVDSDVLMFGFYIYNNIGVAFRTFAGGILFGRGGDTGPALPSLILFSLDGEPSGERSQHETAI